MEEKIKKNVEGIRDIIKMKIQQIERDLIQIVGIVGMML